MMIIMTQLCPHLEHGPHAQGGEAAPPRQHSPDEVDLLAAHARHVRQVGLTRAEDAHHQALHRVKVDQ